MADNITPRLLEPTAQPLADDPVVCFENVSIGFDGHTVLRGISFAVNRGETRIILGPAGCGKSTLMKLTDGLLAPDSGRITVFGKPLADCTESEMFALRAHVGIVFQESALFDSLSVEDNVAYRLNEEHVAYAEAHDRVVEALRFVELERAIDKFPAELSGGMRRRVSIARAIITRPDLLLYDSPTGGLDPITSTTIIELIVKQRDVSGATSLLVTHRLQDAFTLATHKWDEATHHMKQIPNGGLDDSTKFLVLNEGVVVFDGTTLELTHSNDPWLKAYLA
jgi:phospholipid/cholesterol/gamma-HCH transport system ATP-binding protein